MTDYEARIVEARKAQRAVYLAAPEPVAADLSRIIKGLADAVEALVAERDTLREARRAERRALVHRINDYRAERDALRAQLDTARKEALREAAEAVTVEWGTKIVSEPGVDVGTEEYARRNVAQWNSSRYHKGDMAGVVVSRLVSPWTAVEDGEGVSDGQQ